MAATSIGFTVTWDKYSGLLPATYNISVNSSVSQVDMFTSKTNIEVVIPRENVSLANNGDEVMEFAITVIACTSIGCSLDCESVPYVYQGMCFMSVPYCISNNVSMCFTSQAGCVAFTV